MSSTTSTVAGAFLLLKLKKIHRERLAAIERDLYFVCADFVTVNGEIYDIDMFVKGPTRSTLKIFDISVHKEEGRARYTWGQRNGMWKRIPVR